VREVTATGKEEEKWEKSNSNRRRVAVPSEKKNRRNQI
jgi:hypothetical protein